MKKIILALAALVLFSSHVMYLKLDTYFLKPHTPATIKLFNGTFEKSENVIDRNRMLDVSLVGNGNRTRVEDTQWTEKDSITLLNFQTGEEGTWVAGISTAPRSIEMDAKAFNTYLEHEGILDMLAWRQKNNALDSSATEKYAKHVKTIFQVGDKRSDDWKTVLGYPIEFIPLDNPYDLNTGDSLKFKLLFKGKPLANQLVYADFKVPVNDHSHNTKNENGHSHETETPKNHSHEAESEKSHNQESEHGHSHDGKAENTHTHEAGTPNEHTHDEKADSSADHSHTYGQQLRTDADGLASVKLTADGIWYLQTIHLIHTEEEGFTHESNWTTLTFEVTHGHGADTHTHEHEEEGIPSYVYWIASLFLVGLLFLWFNKKK